MKSIGTRWRGCFAGLAVIVVAVALAACGGGGSSSSTTDSASTPASGLQGKVTIGAVLPLTGASASLGEDQQRGIELAVEAVNAKGGVLGKEIEVIVEDSEGTAPAAVNAAKKLVDVNHVPVVIGEYSSGNTIPMGQYLQQQGVVQINPASSSPEVAEIGDFSFSTIGLDNVAGGFAAEQIYNQLKKHRIALLGPDNSYGIGVLSATEKAFKKLGGTIATKVLYTEGQSEYRQDLERIKAAEPEMLAYTAYGTEAQIINKEAFELGLDPNTFYGIYVSQNIADADPEATNGQVGMDVNYIGPHGTAYKTAYEAKFGEEFQSSFSGYSYDAVGLAAAAMNKAKSVKSDAIRSALSAIGKEGYEGVTGDIVLNSEGQRVKQPYVYEEVVNGKPVQVE